ELDQTLAVRGQRCAEQEAALVKKLADMDRIERESRCSQAQLETESKRVRTAVKKLAKERAALESKQHECEASQVEERERLGQVESGLDRLRVELNDRERAQNDRQAELDRAAEELEKSREEQEASVTSSVAELAEAKEAGDRRPELSGTPEARHEESLEQQCASHAAIATFWESFDFSTIGSDADRGPAVVEPQESTVDHKSPTTKDAALRAALAAARAEIEAADEVPPVTKQSPPPEASSDSKHVKTLGSTIGDVDGQNQPVKFTGEMATELAATPAAAQLSAMQAPLSEPVPSTNAEFAKLGAAAQKKLKLLRRLNPAKSEAELLAQIMSQQPQNQPQKQDGRSKRKWFQFK
ncbi:MAG: hypothetical protein IID38_07655, partial [Planctomycetes bacterium]|nr:hypothetical protein [Planctomycetota bacterium]